MDNRIGSKIAFFHSCVVAVGVVMSFAAVPASANFGDELFKLTASDAADGDTFGWRVDISGNIAVVGAPRNKDACPTDPFCNSGSSYLFDVTTGQELFKLTASDAAAGDSFGLGIAIHGNTALIGANGSDSAYIYDVSTGQQLRKLKSTDVPNGSSFGVGLDIQGNVALVGASGAYNGNGIRGGAAYLFDTTTGQELLKLTSSDGKESDAFGYSVAINGNLAIVGARFHDGAGDTAGAAYVFDLTTGQQLWKLTPSDARPFGGFGGSVAVSGNTAIIGAPDGPIGTNGGRGAAYLFDITTGQQLRKLTASDGKTEEQFGWSVGISGNTAIVGARFTPGGGPVGSGSGDVGSAYLFDVTSGQQLEKLAASDANPSTVPGTDGGWFGQSVAISGTTAIVGAIHAVNGTLDTGAAYVFDVSRNLNIPGDFNNDGTVDAADYVVWRNGVGTNYTQTDYDVWRANFGRSAAGAAAVADAAHTPAVPEPSAHALAALAVASLVWRCRRLGWLTRS